VETERLEIVIERRKSADPRPDIAVWLVEDNRMYRSALADVIDEADGMTCALAAENGEEAMAALDASMLPDVVLMDIGLPGMSGIEGVRRVKSLVPAAHVLMLTIQEEDDAIFEAICAGASGYLLKPSSTEEIVAAIRQAVEGGSPINTHIARRMLEMFARLTPPQAPAEDYGLTPRESEILQQLVDGLTMRQIADRLDVSYHTVDAHIRNIYDKLHVHSRSRAVAKALQEGLV